MEREQLLSEALLHAGKARTMAAKLFNDPQASQVDAGDLLISMAQLVDLLCVAATPAPAPLTDEQIKAEAMEAFDSSWDADDETLVNKYGHGVYLSRFIEFARAVERAHGIGKGKESA